MSLERPTRPGPYAFCSVIFCQFGLAKRPAALKIRGTLAQGSTVCPHCGGLNAADEKECFRCGRRLPGPVGRGTQELLESLLGKEYRLTKLYVGLCVVVYVASLLGTGRFADLGSISGLEMLHWGALIGSRGHVEPWRYLSAMFVHGSLLHIGFNMMALWDFGRATEQRFGSGRFSLIFILTGVLGFAGSEIWYLFRGELFFTVGASGGLFGLLGALIGNMYASRDPRARQFMIRAVIYLVVMSFIPIINNSAHVVGFLLGLPLGFAFYKEKRPWERDKLMNVLAVGLLALSIGSVLLCWRIPKPELVHYLALLELGQG
jgi:rhomboid protease GluP